MGRLWERTWMKGGTKRYVSPSFCVKGGAMAPLPPPPIRPCILHTFYKQKVSSQRSQSSESKNCEWKPCPVLFACLLWVPQVIQPFEEISCLHQPALICAPLLLPCVPVYWRPRKKNDSVPSTQSFICYDPSTLHHFRTKQTWLSTCTLKAWFRRRCCPSTSAIAAAASSGVAGRAGTWRRRSRFSIWRVADIDIAAPASPAATMSRTRWLGSTAPCSRTTFLSSTARSAIYNRI